VLLCSVLCDTLTRLTTPRLAETHLDSLRVQSSHLQQWIEDEPRGKGEKIPNIDGYQQVCLKLLCVDVDVLHRCRVKCVKRDSVSSKSYTENFA